MFGIRSLALLPCVRDAHNIQCYCVCVSVLCSKNGPICVPDAHRACTIFQHTHTHAQRKVTVAVINHAFE